MRRSSAAQPPQKTGGAAQPTISDPSDPEPAALSEALLLFAAQEDTTIAVETERRRLAHLLQDNVVEPLNLLLSQANAYEQSLGANPTTRMAISVLASLTRQVIQQTRDLEDNLHPATLENLGLEPALETLTSQMTRAYGLQITLDLQRMPDRPPAPIELAIFRTAQEALERAIHQAHASQVAITLHYRDEALIFHLTDNGLTETEPGQEPLQAARQRIEQLGGTVALKPDPQRGWQLTIRFPRTEPVQLTPREMDVIQLLVEGLSNKEIAGVLSIKPRTVNFHLDNIYSKLGVNSRTEAAIYALRQGWMRRPG